MDSGYISSRMVVARPVFWRWTERREGASRRSRTIERTRHSGHDARWWFSVPGISGRVKRPRNFCDIPDRKIHSSIPYVRLRPFNVPARTFQNLVCSGLERTFLGNRGKELHDDGVKWNVSQSFSLLYYDDGVVLNEIRSHNVTYNVQRNLIKLNSVRICYIVCYQKFHSTPARRFRTWFVNRDARQLSS